MKAPPGNHAESIIVEALADLLYCSPEKIRSQAADGTGYDYAIAVSDYRFLLEYKVSAAAGPIAQAIERLSKHAAIRRKQERPLMVVPYMGNVGRKLCEQSEISWLDLSGNANIVAPGMRIRVEGRPNKFSERGRPPNYFAPKSSRVARQLLLHPQQFQLQAELARETGLGDGYVSKIVRRLLQEQYLDSNDDGAVRPRNPDLLLDVWQDAYAFSQHYIVRGHSPSRSGDDLLRQVAKLFRKEKVEYAATGLSAASIFTKLQAFELVTIYLHSMPPRSLLEMIDFQCQPNAANLWLVLPGDDGVFHGGHTQNGIKCVSPVQTYLDLENQPERTKDAASELRRKLLRWS